MKRWKKALLLVLVLVLCISLLPVTAEAGSGQEAPMDFVLVVDTSGSTRDTDANKICEEAVRMFVNMVPFENARVAVIAFGHLDRKSPYVFSSSYQETTGYAKYDRYLVHELVPLQEMPDLSSKDKVKELVDKLSVYSAEAAKDEYDGINDSHTPMGLATLAAIDLLQNNGAAKNRACVVLMTDARISSENNYMTDKKIFDELVSDTAAKNGWPIYSIELNDDGKNTQNGEERTRLSNIAVNTKATYDSNGDGKISLNEQGNQVVNEITDVISAFQRIIARFCGGNTTTIPADEDGIAEHDFEVPELTCEQTIIVYSDGLKKVELLDANGKLLNTLTKTEEQEDVISIRDNNHMCIKMICPDPGWKTVKVYTSSYAIIEVYEGPTEDLTLELRSAMQLHNSMSRDTEIPVEAFFTYMGREFRNIKYYTESAVPVLNVYDSITGELVKSWGMTASEIGYAAKIYMSEIPEGAYYAEVMLTDVRFDNQTIYSKQLKFGSIEKNTEIPDGIIQVEPKSVPVGKIFRINLKNYFVNPDATPVSYKLLFNGREAFETTVEDEYMTVDPGMTPGIYELILLADDENMAPDDDPRLPMKLEVTNLPIDGEEEVVLTFGIPELLENILGSNAPQIDLADIYGDPDGHAVEIISCKTDGSGHAVCDENGWVINAVKAGSTKFTVIMSDGVTNADGDLVMTERELNVVVHSLLSMIAPFIWALIVMIVLVILWKGYRKMNTRFKDIRKFSVSTQNAQVQDSSEPVDMAIFGKKKVNLGVFLADGIEPCLDLLEYGGDEDDCKRLQNVLRYWEENEATKSIVLHPTSKANGFVIVKGKKAASCAITCNGATVKKKHYISGADQLVISLAENDYELTLRMEAAQDQGSDTDYNME